MRALALKKTRALVVLVVTLAGLALTSSSASAAPVSIELCAVTGNAALTSSVTVPIWGFGVPTTPGDCSTATASLPGPVLTVNEGDSVTVSVTNLLPTGHTVRFEIPGINFNPGPTDAPTDTFPPGTNTVTRTFTATAPGTYLYQSAGDGNRQEAMGLYGALIVRSATAGQAYDAASTAYNVEAPLVLSAVDPAFNGVGQPAGYDPNDYDMYHFKATYWLINGKAYETGQPPIKASAGQRVLLRYVNAGYDNTTMLLLGMHQRVLARDARLLNNPFDADAETIPAGGTEDTIATVPSFAAPTGNGFPLLNRQLHLTNGAQTGTSPSPATGGGMLTFIKAP